jgi:hypothetical protein
VLRVAFSEREAVLIELLADLGDRRSKELKAVEAGYHEKSVYRVLQRADIQEAITNRVRENLGIDIAEVFRVLVKEAIGGNLKACELLLRSSGWIAPPGGQTNVLNVAQQRDARNEDFAARLRDRQNERLEQYRRIGGPGAINKDEVE